MVTAKTSSGKTAIVRTGSKAEAKYKAQGAAFSSDQTTLRTAKDDSKARTTARNLSDPLTVAENNGETIPSYIPPPVINSANLAPTAGINLPTPPAPSGTGTAAMTQVGGLVSAPPAPEAAQADSDFNKYLKSIVETPSVEKIYAKAEKEAGVQAKQQTVNNLTGQLNAIVAKSQADKLSLVGQGRGVTEAIIGGQQAQIDREAAIQSLPISAQLAAAQGDLESAQSHLETLFRIRSEDAKNKADYKNKVAETIYNYATTKQKAALDARRLQDERQFTLTRDNIAYQRDLAQTALQTGQSSLLTSILSLDPSSKDFNTSIGSVASRISVPQKGSGGGSSASAGIRESIADAADAVVNGEYSYDRALARLRTLYGEDQVSTGDLINMLDYAIDPNSATAPANDVSVDAPSSPIEQDIAELRAKSVGFNNGDIRMALRSRGYSSQDISTSSAGGVVEMISSFIFGE